MGACSRFNNNANRYRRERDQARRENNWHIRDRNRWRWRSNNAVRQINKLKNRAYHFPRNTDPSNMKYFAEQIAKKAGMENIKLHNELDSHVNTQNIMKKDRLNKLKLLSKKENNLKSRLILNDRLLMYRSRNIFFLKVIYRIIYLIVLLTVIIFGYKYNRQLGTFIEGKYNKYWNREWYDFKLGVNYVIF